MPTFNEVKRGYAHLWSKAEIDAHRVGEILKVCQRILIQKKMYTDVEAKTGVPWFWIAAVHYREINNNQLGGLYNGQPWNIVTTIHPKGKGPFSSFEAGAIDALRYKKLDKVSPNENWSIERCLYEFERYNGWGYFGVENSPYVWAGTTMSDETGKYVSDGVYNPNAVEKQLGCAAIVKTLISLDTSVKEYLIGKTAPIGDPEDDLDENTVAVLVKKLLSRDDIENVLVNYSNKQIGINPVELKSMTLKRSFAMNETKVLGQVRHVLTLVGGVLTTFGFFTPDEVGNLLGTFDKIAGPALIVIGQVWSWMDPSKK